MAGNEWERYPDQAGLAKFARDCCDWEPAQLVSLIGELYRLSRENQRFLDARLADASETTSRLSATRGGLSISGCLRKGAKVRIAEAKRTISQYQRATGDRAGTVDLMLTFVEMGTAFAVDLGYCEDGFFTSL